MKYLLLLFVLLVPLCEASRAADPSPFLKPNDVIALVGGEDMVAASEYGYLELLLQRALPSYHLKVRSLAWEGDTVFEQPRDLNYPTLEQQLDDLGATVVIMQFGQMESLAGTSKLPEFIKAYEKLIERVSAGGKRKVVMITPRRFETRSAPEGSPAKVAASVEDYRNAINDLADRKKLARVESPFGPSNQFEHDTRDGVHLDHSAAFMDGRLTALELTALTRGFKEEIGVPTLMDLDTTAGNLARHDPKLENLRQLIVAKNRLWFHYTRPQNWAFLNGDRTEQPSSRDHLDPSKRWFPEEMKQWLPLVDAKEKEIWDLAAKASSESAKETKPSK